MSLSTLPLSYCANVHPGETFATALDGLQRYTGELQRRRARPGSVGLWMTRQAVREARDPVAVAQLRGFLDASDLVVYTMNAFPLGNFHARRVKEQVYLPDWTTDERADYSIDVAELLAELLPEGVEGSLSTSPCAFAPLHPAGAGVDIYFARLIHVARHLAALRDRSGKTVRLAIEPEPYCVLQTTDEAIRFFERLWSHVAGTAEEAPVREHLGLCYDICHQAVEFEDVADSVRRLDAAGVRLVKIHVTCALEARGIADPEVREHLSRFVEERYLHQTFALTADGRRLSIPDLTQPHALGPPPEWQACDTWRVHFHVPVNEEQLGPLFTTRPLLRPALAAVAALPYAPHLEVETYTWNVLPREEQGRFDLVAGLADELAATEALLQHVG